MAFQVEKKVGKNTYVYSVESVWDKESKKVKKRYVYVGKKECSTGSIVIKNTGIKPQYSTDYGSRYFVNEIINKLKLDMLLKECFSEYFEVIQELLIFQVVEAKPSYLMEYSFSNKTTASQYSSQNLSILFKKLGESENQIHSFFKSWLNLHNKQDGLFYDITSFSSYSDSSEIIEWGYNRDKENLPQINFGLLYGTTSKLPLMYKVYQGSINDVSTLPNIHKDLQAYSMKKFMFCFDRGFYSAKNMNIVSLGDYDVLVPMPFTTKEAESLAGMKIDEFDMMYNFSGNTTYCKGFPITIGENNFFATVYQNESKRIAQLDKFSHDLLLCEKELIALISKNEKLTVDGLNTLAGRYSKYFKFSDNAVKIEIVRNIEEIQKITSRMGKIILITKTKPTDFEETILAYRSRDSVEKSFDIMKNEMNEGRLRVSSTESIYGRLFVNFLVLIIETYILNGLKSSKLNKRLTVNEIILELKKLKKIELFNGSNYLTEISKTQKTIFEKFKIKLPNL